MRGDPGAFGAEEVYVIADSSMASDAYHLASRATEVIAALSSEAGSSGNVARMEDLSPLNKLPSQALVATPSLLARLDERDRPTLWRLCAHEAGHSVMAILDGCGVNRICIALLTEDGHVHCVGGTCVPARLSESLGFLAGGEAGEWVVGEPLRIRTDTDDRQRIRKQSSRGVTTEIAAAVARMEAEAPGAVAAVARALMARGHLLGAEVERIIAPRLHPWRREMLGLSRDLEDTWAAGFLPGVQA